MDMPQEIWCSPFSDNLGGMYKNTPHEICHTKYTRSDKYDELKAVCNRMQIAIEAAMAGKSYYWDVCSDALYSYKKMKEGEK